MAYIILEATELLHMLGQQEQRAQAADEQQQAKVPPSDKMPPILAPFTRF
jgi:hypothetical protein